LQTVWLFISELAGRDLGFFMIIRFLLYSMPRIIPLVLPLSVLLASIMTFGSLAENYEFAAIKSAGISLGRAMKYLTFFIIILTGITFFFANNVIPYAEYKFINFRRNIAQQSPAMSIVEGQFSEVGNYTIKVGEKSGEKGNFLKDITIHIKANDGTGLKTVIKAKTGELISSESSNILKLVLNNGYYYEEIVPKKYEERNKIPFAKSSFVKDVINIDLSKLNTNMDTGEIANTNTMLNVSQLKYTIDSLNTNYKKDVQSYALNISQRNQIASNKILDSIKSKTSLKKIDLNDITGSLPIYQKEAIYKNAKNNIESTLLSIDGSRFEFNEKLKNINNHWIALYDKFVIAFSCILMFFIGAPLGAIIRKGGLGLPIVFAVGIFIVFHFVNTFGKKLAQQNGISAFLGTWMSTLILLPLAVLLTYRATNDIGLVSFDNIINSVTDFFEKILPKKKIKERKIIQNVETISDSSQVKSTINNTEEITKAINSYNKSSLFAVLFYSLILILMVLFSTNNKIVNIIQIILFIALIFFIFIGQKKLDLIEISTSKKIHPGLIISLLLGFPFYILIFLYNRFTISKLK
jgi:lipopolysaccharide export system permease protein